MQFGLQTSAVRFFVDGERAAETDTAETFALRTGGRIEACCERFGGGRKGGAARPPGTKAKAG